MSDNLGDFLSGLQRDLTAVAQIDGNAPKKVQKDLDFEYFTTPAPNAIEWGVREEFLGVETMWHHTRQYQIIRDFFQLRCPLSSCNEQSVDARDCWGKSQQYLESENLLAWSSKYGEDVCPSCRSTRSELTADGLINLNTQCHVIAGMRTTYISTHLRTSSGLKRFKDLLPANPIPDTFYPLKDLKVFGEAGWEDVSDVYYSGEIESSTVKLKNGIEHVTSRVHPMYGFNDGVWGWHRANTIKPGAHIEVHAASDWVGKSTDITEDEASLMGYLISEGSINSEKAWKFTNGDEETIQHFNHLLGSAFNYHTAHTYIKKGTACKTVDACNANMRARLRSLGLKASIADNKSVPEALWNSTEAVVAAYLRAYFEGDGTAAVEKNAHKQKHPKSAVACYTISKQLAVDTQQLLLNMGVECSIVTSKSRHFGTGGLPFADGHLSYSIRIYGRNILKYAEKIGFNSARKKAALCACVDVVKSTKLQDVKIPGLQDVLNRINDRMSFTARLCSLTVGVRNGCNFSISRNTVLELIEYLDGKLDDADVRLLKRLSNPWSRFVKVVSIKDGPPLPMADLHVPGTHSYIANSVMNHNSGKTATASIIGTYVEHRIITLGHGTPGGLSKYFSNQLRNQPFEITFIASTDVQSADTIWARYTSLRQDSQWMSKYVKWIKQKELDQVIQKGAKTWQYEERTKDIVHGALNLKINSMNSNSSGMAGRTRIASFIDELARFENTDSSGSADECYRVLENSLRTIRSASSNNLATPWLGAMFSISSPISEDDKSMRLLKQAPSIKGMYYGHYATWEFNPDQPREMFDDDFAKDPIGAMRDFGARPPTVASPLIQDPNRFRELAIQPDLKPTATFKKYVHVDKTGREYVSAKVDTANMLRNGERYITFDAGSSFDQFAGACAHGEWVVTPEGKQLVTVFDWVVRVLPEGKPRREVWFDFVVTMLDHLSKYYYIGRIEFDRWQSTYLIQQIRNRGIFCEMKGTTADHFNKFINDVNYSKVRMLPPMPDDKVLEPPFMSAAGLAFYELERLERSPDLKKVFNPKKGLKRGHESDDVATVVAHVNSMVQNAVIDINNNNSQTSRLKREQSGSLGSDRTGVLYRPMHGNKRLW